MINNLRKFKVDLTGKAESNRVQNEEHVHTHQNEIVIVPNMGPFYTESFILRSSVDNSILREGKDYQYGNFYQRATKASGKSVYSLIYLLKPKLGTTYYLDYQAIGGEYAVDLDAIYDILLALKTKDEKILWDEIIKPDAFPPSEHRHNADELYGMDNVVQALLEIAQELRYHNNTLVDKVVSQVIAELTEGILSKVPIENIDGLKDILNGLAAADYNLEVRVDGHDAEIVKLKAKDVELLKSIKVNKGLIDSLRADLTAALARISTCEQDISWIKQRLIQLQTSINEWGVKHNQLLDRVNSLRVDVDKHTQEIRVNLNNHNDLKAKFSAFKDDTVSKLASHKTRLDSHDNTLSAIQQEMASYIFYRLRSDINQSGVLSPDTVWLAESNVRRTRPLPTQGLRGGEIICIKDATGTSNRNRIDVTGAVVGSPEGIYINIPLGYVFLIYVQERGAWQVYSGR